MKNFFLPAVIASSLFLFGCGNAEEKNQESMPPADTSKGVSAMTHDSTGKELAYICPCGGCPEIRESKPGNCSKCEMELVQEKK